MQLFNLHHILPVRRKFPPFCVFNLGNSTFRNQTKNHKNIRVSGPLKPAFMVAISTWIFFQVGLMIFSSGVKCSFHLHVCRDSLAAKAIDCSIVKETLQFRYNLFCNVVLNAVICEDNACVLSALVISLAIESRRIVKSEEISHNFFVFGNPSLEVEVIDLNVSCRARTNSLIGWILVFASHESHFTTCDLLFEFGLEKLFCAPVATC